MTSRQIVMAFQIPHNSILCSTICSCKQLWNIKAPHYWLLWGDSTDETSSQRASTVESVSISWRHHNKSKDNETTQLKDGSCDKPYEMFTATTQFLTPGVKTPTPYAG